MLLIFNNLELVEEANIIIPEEELDFSFLDSALRNLTFSKMGKEKVSSSTLVSTLPPISIPSSLQGIIHGTEDPIIDRKPII